MSDLRKVAPASKPEIQRVRQTAPEKYFNLPLTILLLFGMLPVTSDRSFVLRLLISTYFWCVYILFIVLNTLSKGISLPYQKNLDDLTDNVGWFLSHLIATLKMAIFMSKRKDMLRLVEELEGQSFRHADCSHKFSANRLIRKAVITTQAAYSIFVVLLAGLIANGSVTAIMKRSEVIPDSNVTESVDIVPQYERALPFHSWYPFSTQISPNYEIAFVYQLLGLILVSLPSLAVDALILGSMIHIKVQFRILSHNLRFIKSHLMSSSRNSSSSVATTASHTISEETAANQLVQTIESDLGKHIAHHQAIIQISKDLESVFTYQLLVQFICNLISGCMLMWQVSTVSVLSAKFSTMAFHLGAVTSQLFMYCWFGNEMMLESLSVAEAAWDSGWDEILSRRYCYGVAMIIQRSQKMIKFTAGGFSDLTLETFMTVGVLGFAAQISKAAFSCYAVLKKVDI